MDMLGLFLGLGVKLYICYSQKTLLYDFRMDKEKRRALTVLLAIAASFLLLLADH